MSSSDEEAIHKRIKAFQRFLFKGDWNELVETCYSQNATLVHFVAPPEPIVGRDAILKFFQTNKSGYSLELQYTLTPLLSGDTASAWLVAGVGRVNDHKAWCPFVERWENIDDEWVIVQDKVYSPESWME